MHEHNHDGAAPARHAYDYAVIRLVPRVERGEFINVGVILSCPDKRFLEARCDVNRERIRAFDPALDLDEVHDLLAAVCAVCAGGEASGPLGRLTQRERFHWLTSPRSAMVQMSPAHPGVCDDPAETLEHLLDVMVRVGKNEGEKS